MKILLSSVFGPFGVDDTYGRKENIIELFHNQVTREQGLFSMRYHHQSFGLYMIAENIQAPTVILDFPSEKRFIKEIKKGYDYIGISFIVPNFIKARRMAELVRRHAPKSKIILGGHGTGIPKLKEMIEYDHICQGEGVLWMRKLLGEKVEAPFRHPVMGSAFRKQLLGIPLKVDSAVLIPGVGCPNACRFCATSHFFDKQYTPFFDTGRELFDICVDVEKKTGFREFFVMDENFLKRPERAHEFVQLLEKHEKAYSFGIFSSAETVSQLGQEFLARMGVSFLWLGVESKREVYAKNKGIDLKALIRDLRDHGVAVLASGILFLEHHDKESIWEDIRFISDLEADLVQFMGLGPLPGTALYEDYSEKKLLREDLPYEEWHGQHMIWFKHPHFSGEESARFLKEAFQYEYDRNGASLLRMIDTALRGYQKMAGSSVDSYLVKRREAQRKTLITYQVSLPVFRKFAHTERTRYLAEEVMSRYEKELGPLSLAMQAKARAVIAMAGREAKRVDEGRNVYQPKTLRTRYRLSVKDLAAESLKGRSLGSWLDIRPAWATGSLSVELNGAMDRVNMKALSKKLSRYLKKEDGELILSIKELIRVEDKALERLLEKMRRYHLRVRLTYDEGVETAREAINSLPHELSMLFVQKNPIPA